MASAALPELLREVGLPADAAARTTITGADPVVAARFPVGEAAATVLAACGAAAALLWRERGGGDQDVRVDVPRAAASLVSHRFLQVDGLPAPPRPANPLVALYECSDGRWIHLHGSFPGLAARTLEVLGCEAEREAVAAAVGRWRAQDLEDALAASGTCGAMAREAGEWRALPQARAVAGLGRVSVEKIGDSAPEPAGNGSRPLGGVRVLDLTRVLAGPTHGRTLAEHGADVLLVNSPALPNPPTFVMDTSHGKLSTFLDLQREEDSGRLRALAGTADVFAQGYRSGALARRGLGPAELARARPGLVYVTINCYGDAGPWRERPGWEQLAQSATGLAAAQGAPGAPALMPAAACDYTTGYLAALGTMAALWRRSREGGSYHVRASLCQTGAWFASLGPVCDPEAASGLDGASAWMVERDTQWGRLRYLAPVAEMSGTPPRWDRPSAPLGAHPPEWPEPVRPGS
ncbi:MAG TPA: CoA transferase [Candidatus Dormibacteraeota bacterium]|nr:CoA transferase [Candidatus Dormibacteraeota bacterium]